MIYNPNNYEIKSHFNIKGKDIRLLYEWKKFENNPDFLHFDFYYIFDFDIENNKIICCEDINNKNIYNSILIDSIGEISISPDYVSTFSFGENYKNVIQKLKAYKFTNGISSNLESLEDIIKNKFLD